jgi:hypothetical protein
MFDEPRNHDPKPTEREREWMTVNPVSIAVRFAAVAGIAMLLGLAVSQTIDVEEAPVATAASER